MVGRYPILGDQDALLINRILKALVQLSARCFFSRNETKRTSFQPRRREQCKEGHQGKTNDQSHLAKQQAKDVAQFAETSVARS